WGAPVAAVPLHGCAAAGAVVDVARRDHGNVRAHARDRLHLRGHPQPAVGVVAPVQRADAHVVAGDDDAPGPTVPQGEGEDAVHPRQPGFRGFAAGVQGVEHFAVGAGGEAVAAGQALLEFAVVVDLTVD